MLPSLMRNALKVLYAAVFVPPVYAFLASGSPDFSRRQVVFLGLFGTIAFVAFGNQFILTARRRMIERYFGLDRLIRFHMVAGIAALGLVFLHTAFEFHGREVPFQEGAGSAAENIFLYAMIFSLLFFPNFVNAKIPLLRDWSRKIGAWLKISYEKTRNIHIVMFAGFTAAFVHIQLAPIQGLETFKTLIAGYYAVCACWYVFHRFVSPRFLPGYEVVEAVDESPGVRTLALAPAAGRLPAYAPGQFLFVRFPDSDHGREIHPFTIASAPGGQNALAVTVKAVGDFTAALRDIREGDRAVVDAPYGVSFRRFIGSDRRLVLLAGGIGITPFLSLLRHLKDHAPEQKATLLWSARTAEDFVRLAEFRELKKRMPYFDFFPMASNDPSWPGEQGRIDGNRILKALGVETYSEDAVAEAEFFICGPPPMMGALINALKSMGIPKRRIHFQKFSY